MAGTPVTMADGSTKPVEQIKVGDMVMSYDESTGFMKPAPVVAVHAPFTADSYFVINGTVRVTATHPFFSSGGWINTQDLKVGDRLTGSDGSTTIATIEKVEEPARAYNFQVGDGGTYLAAGIVVHNKEICEHFMQYPN